MITLSSITNNTGRYADTYRIFYIPVNFAFNVNIMLLAICTTQVKKRVKKRFKKKTRKITLRKI